MDDDWESEDFVPAAPVVAKEKHKSMWDDEDVEDEDVKESWEDEDKPTSEAKPVSSSTGTAKSEKNKNNDAKGKYTTVQDKRAPESKKEPEKSDEEKLDPLAEKLRQQRLVEEADYQSTTELFGIASGQKSLDSFIPKSEDDFLEYAELIAQKLRPHEKSFQYITLLKAVMRNGMTNLKAADAKEIASTATVIANEKIRSEKEISAGKKKGSKKKQIHVDREEDDPFVGVYDDQNEYDFM